jgi:glycosyltransferase involved in cell wall biosynthesis
MGLRVGIVAGNDEPEAGGAWTFSTTLIEAVKGARHLHTFILLDDLLANVSHDERVEQPASDDIPPPKERRPLRAMADIAVDMARAMIRRSGRPPTSMLSGKDEGIGRLEGDISAPEADSADRLEALIRRERIDIVWLMKPRGPPVSIPYIATVWDLEHRKQPYFPEVSTTGWTWTGRENHYNDLLPRASMIVAGTQVGKDEIARYYHVNLENIIVIPFPAPTVLLKGRSLDPLEIKRKYRIDRDFLLYPAQFWPHKNHVNLLRALKVLRDQDLLDVDLVLTGGDKGNRDHVMNAVAELDLCDHVLNLGFVSREDLNALYRASMALVFPSYFGPDNFPPLEAFALGAPVIAAKVPGAEEQLGGSAMFFDPSNPLDIAAKIEVVCRKPGLRAEMISQGAKIANARTPESYITTLCSFLDRFEAIRRCWGVTYSQL